MMDLLCEVDELEGEDVEDKHRFSRETGFCPVTFQYLENTVLLDEMLLVLPRVETDESSSAAVVSLVRESSGGKLSYDSAGESGSLLGFSAPVQEDPPSSCWCS
jgi:hypothetical protein